jgi:hypothetical protein
VEMDDDKTQCELEDHGDIRALESAEALPTEAAPLDLDN